MYEMSLENVTVRFGKTEALKNFTLQAQKGEFLALLGPSGCGKTTTLRTIAGFIEPDEGEVFIKGRVVNQLPPYKRKIGLVFQNYALFPHMTVSENIAFGLRMMRLRGAEKEEKIGNALKLLRLEGLQNRFPSQLSGGQQQRVALARAVVINPDLLLLDEPLGALDKKLREEMQVELRQLQRRTGITTVFVSHDQEEALTLSDRIVVMNEGRIQQIGTPKEIYEFPETKFVSDFIGVSNFFQGLYVEDMKDYSKMEVAKEVHVFSKKATLSRGEKCFISIRPEKIVVLRKKDHSYENSLNGTIINIVYLGMITHYYVKTEFGEIVKIFRQNKGEEENGKYEIGEKVYICWHTRDTLILKY